MRSNQKKVGLTIALVAVMMVSAFTNPAFAQGRGWCMGGMSRYDGRWSNANVPQQYQLSAEQMTSLRDIRSQYDDKIIPLQRERRALRFEAEGYTFRPDAETAKIKSYRNDINKLENNIEDLELDARAQISKILTKEQRAYFGDTFNWWRMDHGMMGDMGCGMGMYDDYPTKSDRGGCW